MEVGSVSPINKSQTVETKYRPYSGECLKKKRAILQERIKKTFARFKYSLVKYFKYCYSYCDTPKKIVLM